MLGIFTDDFYPFIGGMGRYVHELTRRLPRGRVRIFSPCRNHIPNHVRVEPALHRRLQNLSYSFWLHRHIERIIDAYRLTRINIHCGPGGLFLLRSLHVPVIATCHHTYWQQSHRIPSQFWKRVFIPFEKQTYRNAGRVLCQSPDTEDVLSKRYGIDPADIAVNPIGIDPGQFHPIEGSTKIPESLLFVGRLGKRKGVDFLLRSMHGVVEKMPGVMLYIGGSGKGQRRLQKYVHKHHLSENVTFLGHIPGNRMNEWYNRVNCVVVPSMFEGFGLTVTEAMAAGTPVIATQVDSLRNLIADGVDGSLVPYGNVRMLGQRICSLLSDPEKQAAFSSKGIEKAKRRYAWDGIISVFMRDAKIG